MPRRQTEDVCVLVALSFSLSKLVCVSYTRLFAPRVQGLDNYYFFSPSHWWNIIVRTSQLTRCTCSFRANIKSCVSIVNCFNEPNTRSIYYYCYILGPNLISISIRLLLLLVVLLQSSSISTEFLPNKTHFLAHHFHCTRAHPRKYINMMAQRYTRIPNSMCVHLFRSNILKINLVIYTWPDSKTIHFLDIFHKICVYRRARRWRPWSMPWHSVFMLNMAALCDTK